MKKRGLKGQRVILFTKVEKASQQKKVIKESNDIEAKRANCLKPNFLWSYDYEVAK